MILPRALYDDSPPERRNRIANNPTLLYSWWCTIFSLVIIGFRLSGRYIRNERLFREDWIMAGSIIPLLARMGFIHVVLIWGTNNVNTHDLVDPVKIHHREIGSRMVLAARIFYTLFIWMAKFTVSEFLKRMTERFWKKGYEWGLRGIRIFLLVTFIAVVISTLAECHPFSHYWQVIPDPGPQCRQGYGHLLAMGITDIITDILLVAFPIPIILRSSMSIKRKFSLIALFSMSVILIIITGARVPVVIQRHGLQQFRTVLASSEILAAAIISNAIVLGSFLRDRGLKKAKYKGGSVTDSMERRSSHTRRHTLQQWGSDEDLARSLGYRTKPEYAEKPENSARPAPVADLNLLSPNGANNPFSRNSWQFPSGSDPSRYSQDSSLKIQDFSDPMPSPRTGSRRVSFFDVGGLLEGGVNSTPSPTDSVITHDFAPQNRRGSRASNALPPGSRAYPPPARRSSRLSQQSQDHELSLWPSHQLQDPGGLLAESRETNAEDEIGASSTPSTTSSIPIRPPPEQPQQQSLSPLSGSSITRSPTETSYDVPSLQDAGGLLSPSSKAS